MADITAYQSGDFDNSAKVNWRGDQVNIPNAQSIYKSSSVQLAELGMRLVVGDRVFRYAKCGVGAGASKVGELQQKQGVDWAATQTAYDPNSTAVAATAGQKTLGVYAFTTATVNQWAESYVFVCSGTATECGQMFRVKSHGSTASGGSIILSLYDEINCRIATADTISLLANDYSAVIQCTTGATTIAVGVPACVATTNDYFWLQTWGPSSVKNAAATKGAAVVADVTGQVIIAVSATTAGANAQIVGYALHTMTASQYGGVMLTIQP
jgi:hypothetical protein